MDKREFLKAIGRSSVFGAFTLLSGKTYAEAGLGKSLHFMLDTPAPVLPLADHYLMYVGTYTGKGGKGIYAYRYDTKTGQFTDLGVQAEIANPSWVVDDPQHRHLYAVTEMGGGTTEGAISSYSINRASGALTFLNEVSSRGGGPCHLVVDRTGKVLVVANYGSGSIASYAIKADGSLGEPLDFVQDQGTSVNPKRQSGPHCHEVVLSPDNRFLFVPDLGLDQIKVFRFDAANGKLTPNDPPSVAVAPGYGPRHFTFGVGGKFAYLICEIKSSVMVFSYNRASGLLTHLQTISNLPPDFTGASTSAEIQADRSGRFIYASNRGDDSIAVFAIDRVKGTLTNIQVAPCTGKTPRNFVLDPTGGTVLAALQDSDRINILNVDHTTGKLTPANQQLSVPSPVSILFIPA